jgi:aspartate/methionine/tyrosine aminotransferase
MRQRHSVEEHTNQQLSRLHESATIALADKVRKLQASGKKVFALQTGDPDFGTPPPSMDASLQAMTKGLTHYERRMQRRGCARIRVRQLRRRLFADDVRRL